MKPELSQYTLDHFFARVVETHGSRPSLALIGEQPFTYAEFGQRVQNVKQILRSLGVKQQDKVVILGSGCPNWAIAFMAITTMGAVVVPIMEEFPEMDVDHIIRHSEAAAIFISENLYQNLNLPALEKIQILFNLDDFSLLTDEVQDENLWGQTHHVPNRIKKSLEKPSQFDPDQPAGTIEEDDLAEILYTSGTTGHSKGVMLTHKNLVSNLLVGPELLKEINENSVVLSILPMAHAFTSTCAFLTIISRGGRIYYLNKKPSPKILLKAMQEVRPTLIAAVPLIFEKIYHRRVLPAITGHKMLRWFSKTALGKKLLYQLIGKKIKQAFGGRLQCAVIGAAALNREIEIFLREGGIPYVCGYGLSECSPLVTGSTVETGKIGAAGHAVADVSIKIVEPDPESGVGEILVKGPNVMQGYYKNEVETRKVFTEDGWLITGDRGYLDEDGFLYIKGRSKNMILGSSGENIYPEVIEDKLKESLYVEEALVYLLDKQLVARIYPDYNYIESLKTNQDEHMIAADITKILEEVRQETNTKLSPTSRIQKVIEQREPFIKTPTQKIKRAEYVPDYLKM